LSEMHTVTTVSYGGKYQELELKCSVADPKQNDADPDPSLHFDPEPDPTFYFDAYLVPDPAHHKNYANLRPLVYKPSTAQFRAAQSILCERSF
jgi:hypothetical protein